MLAQLLLIASTTICTVEQIPEMGACRRCCTTGVVEACKFIRKCQLPDDEKAPPEPSSPAKDKKE